jgi:hypothetical protein
MAPSSDKEKLGLKMMVSHRWRPMNRRVNGTLLLGLIFVIGVGAANCQDAKGRIARAEIGRDGLVHLTQRDGKEFTAPREASPVELSGSDNMQVSVEKPVISPDGRTAGWLVNFPICCTSYPIPMILVLWRDGGILRRVQPRSGLPVWSWFFLDGGQKVAYRFETTHGFMGAGCEQRDVATGAILDSWFAGDRNKKGLPVWAEPFRKDLTD